MLNFKKGRSRAPDIPLVCFLVFILLAGHSKPLKANNSPVLNLRVVVIEKTSCKKTGSGGPTLCAIKAIDRECVQDMLSVRLSVHKMKGEPLCG